MMEHDLNQLDSIIDGALARYGRAEPLAGIAERVLNRIATADPGHRTSKIMAWAFCCPILIALVPIAISVWLPEVIKPAHIKYASLPQVPPPPNAFAIVRQEPAQPRRRRVAPRPPSISSDERVLLALVESHPAEAQQSFADLQRRTSEPVEIHEIQIAPLQIAELQ